MARSNERRSPKKLSDLPGVVEEQTKYRSPSELSERSGVDVQSIYYFVRAFELSHIRIGRKILINETDWTDFLNRNRQAGVSYYRKAKKVATIE